MERLLWEAYLTCDERSWEAWKRHIKNLSNHKCSVSVSGSIWIFVHTLVLWRVRSNSQASFICSLLLWWSNADLKSRASHSGIPDPSCAATSWHDLPSQRNTTLAVRAHAAQVGCIDVMPFACGLTYTIRFNSRRRKRHFRGFEVAVRDVLSLCESNPQLVGGTWHHHIDLLLRPTHGFERPLRGTAWTHEKLTRSTTPHADIRSGFSRQNVTHAPVSGGGFNVCRPFRLRGANYRSSRCNLNTATGWCPSLIRHSHRPISV